MTIGTEFANDIDSSKIELNIFKNYKTNKNWLSQSAKYLQTTVNNCQLKTVNNDNMEMNCDKEADVIEVDYGRDDNEKPKEPYSTQFGAHSTLLQHFVIPSTSTALVTVAESSSTEAQGRMVVIQKEIEFGHKMINNILFQQQQIQQNLDNKSVSMPLLYPPTSLPYSSSAPDLQIFTNKMIFGLLSLSKFDEMQKERKANENSSHSTSGSINNLDEIPSHLSFSNTSEMSLSTSYNAKYDSNSPNSAFSTSNNSSRNKLGRTYNPGRPLSMQNRHKLLDLYKKGLKISHIAKVIGVTHSCVSKIMSRYRKTGSMRPRCGESSCGVNDSPNNHLYPSSPSRSLSNSSSPLPTSHQIQLDHQ